MIEIIIGISLFAVSLFAGCIVAYRIGHNKGFYQGKLFGLLEGEKVGYDKGWTAREANLIILTEDTIKSGLDSARAEAHRKSEKLSKEFSDKLDSALSGAKREIRDKFGIDNDGPEYDTNQPEDDAINLHRTESPL